MNPVQGSSDAGSAVHSRNDTDSQKHHSPGQSRTRQTSPGNRLQLLDECRQISQDSSPAVTRRARTATERPLPFVMSFEGHRALSENDTIGLALGSPNDSPLPPLPAESSGSHNSYRASSPDVNAPRGRILSVSSLEQVITKQKARGWKAFGGIFGKRVTESMPSTPGQERHSTEAFVRSDLKQALPHTKSNRKFGLSRQTSAPGKVRGSSSDRQPNRPTRMRSTERSKPHMRRANTAPPQELHRTSPPPPPKDRSGRRAHVTSPEPPPKDGNAINCSYNGLYSGSLLKVEIPNIEMDRYSVMFGSLLNPRQSPLLARRQVNVERLKPVGEVDLEITQHRRHDMTCHPPQRTKSDAASKSPLFRPFPLDQKSSPQQLGASSIKPLPLQRSASASSAISPKQLPQKLGSPFKQNSRDLVGNGSTTTTIMTESDLQDRTWLFDLPYPSTAFGQSGLYNLANKERQSSKGSLSKNDNSPPLQPPTSKFSKLSPTAKTSLEARISPIGQASPPVKAPSPDKALPNEKGLPTDKGLPVSPSVAENDDKLYAALEAQLAKKAIIPPTKDTPPPYLTSSETKLVAEQQLNNSDAPTTTSPPKQESPKRSKALEAYIASSPSLLSPPIDGLKDAAEVSIARQISLSRRQRQLLIPVLPKTARQPMQPTLVEFKDRRMLRHQSQQALLEES